MANLTISPEVHYRSDRGRFMAACSAAATASVKRTIREGANISIFLAPRDSGELSGSIEPVMLSAKHGAWGASAGHAMAQEYGAGPHPIGADGQILSNEGAGFGPVRGPVMHSGNPAQPYLRPAYRRMRRRMMEIMKETYPG